ncbi:LacI family DNA-binding transcriptional regulator [Tessaracoccus sp.]|uniref:LacI family DNA-binding transcriptional regulator n=1 Tax=Tessaracoccus sp. TaxID=1971211 RepID=UPI002611BD93|nr:LacI family DNA-binding transcriptional regulator [Tessaracoccus sp.]
MVEGRKTIRDVAARAGVSPGSVSKALNGTGQLRAETRSRIIADAQELNFQLGAHPRGTAASPKRSYTVGLITTDSFARFSVPILLGVEDALGAGQISVFLCDSRDDPIRERHYVETLQRRRVDGFIVTGRSSNRRSPLPVDPSFPVVYALSPSSDPRDCSVVVDDVAIGRIAGEHFIRMGRTKVAHVTGPERFDAARERAEGLAAALTTGGLELVDQVYYGNWSEAWGRQATQMVLRANPDVDAIYCGSDLIARGVGDALRDLGKDVPSDVALIGTDNWNPIAVGARPALTTIDPDLHHIGRIAADCLLDAIDGRPHSGVMRIAGQLVVRGSTN